MVECPMCEGKGYYLEKEGRWTTTKTCKTCNGTGEVLQRRSRLKPEEEKIKFKAEPLEVKPRGRGRLHSAEKTRTTVTEPCTICEPPGSGRTGFYGYGVPWKNTGSYKPGYRGKCPACDGSGETQVTYISSSAA